MSTPIPAPSPAAAADIPVTEATTNAAAAADEHTPETPAPDTVTDPVPDSEDVDETLESVSKALAAAADRIAVLEDTVKSLQAPDDVPVRKRPWTQKGNKR